MQSIEPKFSCQSSSQGDSPHPDSGLKISWIHIVEIFSQSYSWLSSVTKKEHSHNNLGPQRVDELLWHLISLLTFVNCFVITVNNRLKKMNLTLTCRWSVLELTCAVMF